MILNSDFEIRRAGPDDAAALFVVHAAITAADAEQLSAWTQEMEARLETDARVWVAARGRRLAGYALVDSLPGLPGVFDLSGGVVPARRRQGTGARLLRRAMDGMGDMGATTLSCRVESLTDEPAVFLLRRGFHLDHEECLLELTDPDSLPSLLPEPSIEVRAYPRERAVAEFCRLYERSFHGLAWSQPYSKEEVAASLTESEDLLFLEIDGEPVGTIWQEILPDNRGRVEPLGIIPAHQGRGHGRRLLLAALHELNRRGARRVEIGTWRDNHAALTLYKSLGFVETGNWFFLNFDASAGLKSE